MIHITESAWIREEELEENFVRGSGPGGQNVNKVSSAVQLRFNVRAAPGLSEELKSRLERLAGSRLSAEGILVISAQRYRTQEANRADARERLFELIRRAAERPKTRRPTRPTLASKRRRLEEKSRRGEAKRRRNIRLLPE
ncbi:alternative ribosome rescue aminoacyl-tRNA hydrolase ArfB [Microvirga massiliensis]|uniref:alternative ribosome rescue aminoacyl-tRNA hydrolase ArfB n=1 Tax=Microvirga massiliensis TaxID=1033741 RepID=UPI00062B9910|nr:alternative ribosome rescue aminoacyl-tRNA hydrolase ArfB [Microvirga massiliensis]